MYKNKVLGLLSWAWLCPGSGEKTKEGSASPSCHHSLLAPLLDGPLQPFLPSGDNTEETVEQDHAEASTGFQAS